MVERHSKALAFMVEHHSKAPAFVQKRISVCFHPHSGCSHCYHVMLRASSIPLNTRTFDVGGFVETSFSVAKKIRVFFQIAVERKRNTLEIKFLYKKCQS